jgi:hypothetical protein
MKLAEALMLRADLQSRIHEMRGRLARSAVTQEGERPPEDPATLLEEFERMTDELLVLIQAINRTNSVTRFDDGETLSDALAHRDVLKVKQAGYRALVEAASHQQFRYSRSEVKHVSTVDVAEMQRRVDDYARQHRELDTRIQELNWLTDLVE